MANQKWESTNFHLPIHRWVILLFYILKKYMYICKYIYVDTHIFLLATLSLINLAWLRKNILKVLCWSAVSMSFYCLSYSSSSFGREAMAPTVRVGDCATLCLEASLRKTQKKALMGIPMKQPWWDRDTDFEVFWWKSGERDKQIELPMDWWYLWNSISHLRGLKSKLKISLRSNQPF